MPPKTKPPTPKPPSQAALPVTARVHDHSHAPYFRPGDILHLDPTRQAQAGDMVIAILAADRTAMIAELISTTGSRVTLCQGQHTLRHPQARYSAFVVVVGWRRGT